MEIKCNACPSVKIPHGGTLYHLHDGTVVCSDHAICISQEITGSCTGIYNGFIRGLINVNGVLIHATGDCNKCTGCGTYTMLDLDRKVINGRLYCKSCFLCPGCNILIKESYIVVCKGTGNELWHPSCVQCEGCGCYGDQIATPQAYGWGYRRSQYDGAFVGIRCSTCIPCELCPYINFDEPARLHVQNVKTAAGIEVEAFIWAHSQCYTAAYNPTPSYQFMTTTPNDPDPDPVVGPDQESDDDPAIDDHGLPQEKIMSGGRISVSSEWSCISIDPPSKKRKRKRSLQLPSTDDYVL